MLNPVEFIDGWLDGDEEAGNPEGGPFGLDTPEVPNAVDRQPRMYQPWDITGLAVGAVQTLTADSRPEYWLIALDSTASSGVAIYQGSGAGGTPVRLGPGGRARIPGQSSQNSLTIAQTGSAPSNLTVIAVRGLYVELVRVS